MIRLVPTACLAAALALGAVLPARAQDASEFVVRLNRVEGQMRQLSGQVEQLQFENKQLKDQLRKFQEDVEFRFQERSGARPASPGAAKPAKRSDAFDPDADPNAPGAPRTLGRTTTPSVGPDPQPEYRAPRGVGALANRPDGPAPRIDRDEDGPVSGRPLDLGAAGRVGTPAPAATLPPTAVPPQPSAAQPPPAIPPSGEARGDYDIAYAYLIQRQYDQAEAGFRRFLQSHPKDRLAPDAVYWLGETFMQRNRPREAAEQFLKVSTDYSRAGKAPDAMLKLGVALGALGARDQACATFAELERKYPAAPASVKQGADREQKRARCAA